MSFIELVDVEGADAANYERLFARRPQVFAAWHALRAAIADAMDERRYELATLAAARELRSSYCSLAHGRILAERFVGAETVLRLASDPATAELDETDAAVVELAAKVAADATSVTQADVDRLRELGLSDEDVFDVVLAAAARSFLTKAVDGMGVRPDASYAALEPTLRDALTVGRPIATA